MQKTKGVTLERGAEYRVLSVIQPWAWAIMFAGKDVENRTRASTYTGPILIHAPATKLSVKDIEDARKEIARCAGLPFAKVPTEFPRSQILGMIDVVDFVRNSRSPWSSERAVHWVLRDPRPLAAPITDVSGKHNLWRWTYGR